MKQEKISEMPQVFLRLPTPLYRRLQHQAREHERSLSAEVRWMVMRSLADQEKEET